MLEKSENLIFKEENFLMIVKPDAVAYLFEISNILSKNNIRLLYIQTQCISRIQANQLYSEHFGKYFYNTLINYLTTSNSIVLALSTDNSDLILNVKESIRDFIREKNKHDLKGRDLPDDFVEEYLLTFGGIHLSDSGKGNDEISIFFPVPFKNSIDFETKKFLIEEKIEAKSKLDSMQQPNMTRNYSNLFM